MILLRQICQPKFAPSVRGCERQPQRVIWTGYPSGGTDVTFLKEVGMSRRLLLSALLVLCTVSAGAAAAATDQAQADQQKMMEEYMKLLALGPNHDYFKDFVGKWDVKTTAWMTPGAEPAVSRNVSEATLILGGRFLMTKFSGNIFGQAFEGLQIDGYDNLTKKYVTFWIDNSSTGFYFLDVGYHFLEKRPVFEQDHDRHVLVDKGNGAVLHLPGRVAFGVDV